MVRSRSLGMSAVASALLALFGSFVAAIPASAVPHVYGQHPYAYETQYPTISACAGTFQRVLSVSGRLPNGHAVSASLYYSNTCGAYARQDSPAADHCAIGAFRDSRNGSVGTLAISESNDGLNYAYTEMVNDLSGRLARAELTCGTPTTPSTPGGYYRITTSWY